MAHGLSSWPVVTFSVTDCSNHDGRSNPRWEVDAAVLPKITTELPTFPVSFSPSWKRLSGLRLADPNFGTPGRIDILLGVDIFNRVICHGRQIGPPGTPSVLETSYGWVLSDVVDSKGKDHQSRDISMFSVTSGNDLL